LGREAVALRLDTGDIAGFAPFAGRLRAELRETWGRETFDYLVNNAGHGDMAPIAETTEAQFDRLVNVHFKGVFFLTQALLPLLADAGRIVNLSSGLTRVSFPGFAAYAAVKGAVEVLTVYMAKELGARGIAANAVAPGAIETDFGGGAVRDKPGPQQAVRGHDRARPGRRAGRRRAGGRGAAVGGQPLGQRAADRGVRRTGHLIGMMDDAARTRMVLTTGS
jgi:NAD(P)-dependent dehydrogenase (short-subunit alcohol dehydrogenase family)